MNIKKRSSGMNVKNFFTFIFTLWYGTEIIFNTTLKSILGISIGVLNNIVSWFVFALLMIQIIFLQSYKKKELIVVMAITLPLIIATVLSGNRQMLSTWMFIVAAKNDDFDKIVRIAYRISLIMIPFVIVLCGLGFIENYTFMRGDIRRYSLGFLHPNYLGVRVFQLVLCNCYVNRDKLNISNYGYIVLAIMFSFKVPNSQTIYISMIVFLVLLLIYKCIENQKQIFVKLYGDGLLIGAIILNALSLLLSFIDVNRYSLLLWIDRWMSRRFSWGHRVWQIYGTSFLGQRIYYSEEETRLIGIDSRLFLDNTYVCIFLTYGILVFLIFSISYIFLMRKMIVHSSYILVIILFLYALYGVMESGLYMIKYNIFLIAFAELLYHKTNTKKNLNEKENHQLNISVVNMND